MSIPKESSVLEQWEAEAKNTVEYPGGLDMHSERELGKRILALIDLVRKKDEALKRAYEITTNPGMTDPFKDGWAWHYNLDRAFELTEKLNDQ